MFTEIIIKFLTQLIAFFQANGILTFFIFVVSLFVLYKLIKLALRILIVVGIGAAFPFIMNYFLNWGIPVSFNSIIFYATTAALLYLFGIFVRGVFRVFGKLLSPIKKRKERKRMEEEIEEDLEKK